ncbi:protein BolA isoform X2 [Biomphalaria glabrata]|uniref:BolA-like protein n=1 Tax=Biomphalaria glabrata TaxID=6526 RepID=A0A2C9M2L7_BIOGL|nr:protein BolA isoform X2 [Biomphalaria glabrata]
MSRTFKFHDDTILMAVKFQHLISNIININRDFLYLSSANKHLIYKSFYATVKMGDEKPVENAIRTKLTEALKPEYIEVINESYMHNVPKGTESHFKVVIVSSAFENVKRIEKHQLVHKAIQEELDHSIHALSIVAKTPKEWEVSKEVGQSPACRGGAGL